MRGQILPALILSAVCQTAAAQSSAVLSNALPGPDSAGILHHFFWDFRCRFGPAAAQTRDLRIDIDFGPVKGIQQSIITDLLEEVGYTVEQPVQFGPYQTVPRTDWPADAPDAIRAFTYPGTGVQFTQGLKPDNKAVAFGGVSLLCNSDPGAPDSVAMIAQRLEAGIVTAAFARRGFRVRVGKQPHDGFR